jgi:hypothetical protein
MFNGQSQQDRFVLNVLNYKKNGYFLEIGSHHPIIINNSYLLETKYNWKGIMVDCVNDFLPLYKQHRPNSIHVINDTSTIDYKNLFEQNNFPTSLDYLEIDLEVSDGSTIETLIQLDSNIFDTYKFATVTFKHDIYNTNFANTRIESRKIFKKRGYICVFEDINNHGYPYEDWYVHPALVNMVYINNLIEYNKSKFTNHSIVKKTINWQHIQYI